MNVRTQILNQLTYQGCRFNEADGIITVITPDGKTWDFTTPKLKEVHGVPVDGVLAVYRVRDDGDGDLIAAFDVQNTDGWFADNSGDGADRLCTLVQDALTDEDEESVRLRFQHMTEMPEVFTNVKNALNKA